MGVWMEVAGDDDLGVKVSWEITHSLPDSVLYGELPDGEDDLDCEAVHGGRPSRRRRNRS